MPPGSQKVEFSVNPRLIERDPDVDVTIGSERSSGDLWSYYESAFASRGWKAQKHFANAEGKLTVEVFEKLDSKLSLSISSTENPQNTPTVSKVHINIETHHFWDWPPRWDKR